MTPINVGKLWMRMARDPVFFANTLLPMRPHPGQAKWLRDANQAINVLVPGNRYGKSVVVAMRHMWHCMFKVGARPSGKYTWKTMPYDTISVAMSADQAEIVFNVARRMLQHPAIAPFVTKVYVTPFPRIVFWNGAVFHCRSAHDDGKYIDGHQYRFVSIDEAGWIKNLKGLMTGVILMRLAGGGMVDLIGTPKGYGDLFWYAERGIRKVPGYHTQKGSIYDNPYLSRADIEMRDRLLSQADARLRDQVINGAFVDLDGLAFTQDQRDQTFVPGLPAHQPFVDGHKYVQAWDLGRRTDYTVGVTLDVTTRPFVMVDYVRLNKVPWEEIYRLIGSKAKEYRVHMPRIDATGPQGDVIEEELYKRGIPVDPYRTSTKNEKTGLINNLQSALDYGRKSVGMRVTFDEANVEHEVPDMEQPGASDWGLLRMPCIPQLLDEFGIYMLDDKDLVQDSVMAVALAVEAAYSGEMLRAPVLGGLYSQEGD
jgi:hypothetical protein